jgi:hypothetical protein
MKKILLAAVPLLAVGSHLPLPIQASSHEEHHQHNLQHSHQHNHQHHLNFEIHKQNYTFSTYFDCFGDGRFYGTIYKSSFHLTTHYDLYSDHGDYEGQGVCRLLTLGAIYDWGREIDLYDKHGDYIGMIDGQLVTESKAKFSIYDGAGTRVGIAYLDNGSSSFSIIDPNNEFHYLAILKRHFVDDAIDHWNVTVYEKEAIDLRIIKVFAAFAVDSQGSFKEDL